MALRKIDLDRWERYFSLREEGYSVERASRAAKIDSHTAWRFERGEPGSTGVEAAEQLGITHVGGLEVAPEITSQARKALDDFGYFRRRYFGRVSTPWQESAAYEVRDAYETPAREYVCMNEPPGAGKSTLFTHDIPAWLVAKDRSIRIQVGSLTEKLARLYISRLKKTFERTVPMVADTEMKDLGVAYDAEATLAGDFGMFRPEGRTDLWRADALVVRQFGGVALDDKEPTLSAWGQDSGILGGRYDVVLWDDLVNLKNSRGDAYPLLVEWWLAEAEPRLEPGGVLILQGQRINSDDLYRFCLDRTDFDGNPKYRHVVYPAHSDDRCKNDHDDETKIQLAYPAGCLLDPWRLPWKFLAGIKADTPKIYEIQYQQNDGEATSVLCERVWLEGGIDSSGVFRPGCYDTDRHHGKSAVPEHTGWSLISVDPSPSEYWGITWWVMDPLNNRYEVVEVHRKRMGSEQFLSIDLDTHVFSGLLEEIRQRGVDIGHPIQTVVIEINAAQKFLLAQPHMQRWASANGITLMPHVTARNKDDEKLGPKGISDFFRQGAVRLPWGDPEARLAVRSLTHELLTWPDGVTSDLVMSTWFAIRTMLLNYVDRSKPPPRFARPSYLGHGRALADVYGR